MTHGALSPAIYGARAAELIEQLLTSRPDLAEFPSAVKSWAVAEARAELLRAHEARVGLLDGDDPRAFTKLSVQVENQLKDARRVLGLDPMAAAALAKERASAAVVSVNLSQMAEQGRAVLDARTDPVAELLAGEELI